MNIERGLASIGGQKSLANGRAELEPEMHRGSIAVASNLHDGKRGVSQIWGGNSLAVNRRQRRLALFASLGETQRRRQARPDRGVRQLGRVRGQAQGRHLRGSDGTGGTWFGWTRSNRHLLRISPPGR